MITFELTEEQQLISDMLTSFARDEMAPKARDIDEAGEIPQDILKAGWDLGLVSATIPEAHGGSGTERSPITSAIILEKLGYGCASIATSIMASSLFVQPIVDFGTDDQKSEYLGLFTGDYHAASMALQEPHFTFDVIDMKTTATKKGDNWVINGVKRLVPLGATASHFLVIARNGKDKGLANIDAFIVPRDIAGLTIEDESGTQGLKPVATSSLTFDKVEVPGKDRLGGDAGIDGRRLINTVRLGGAALAIGVAHAATDLAIPYARDRVAFGEPIGKKQSIAFMLSEMHSDVEAMRWMLWKASSQLENNEDATKATTLAKDYINRLALRVSDNALQVFGGHGFIRELPLEMWLRNARTLTLLEGPVAV
jgi:alkylation response protein AidB-like acyl-CoA dehydrogenase